MDLISRISENFSESAHLKLKSIDALAAPIAAGVQSMVHCLQEDGKILACGNGGSAADACSKLLLQPLRKKFFKAGTPSLFF